jgi:hypothetical protein
MGALLACSPAVAAGPGLGFGKPLFVDQELAGGEPIVFADVAHGTLIYSAHEGTTHLYRPGLASTAPASFLANYRNQVNVWTSTDNGATWKRSINNVFNGADPSKDQGFSDPDLTQDEGGRVYDTGINLANDSLFSSIDGGRTFDKGTAQCHDGDRPWLAAGKAEEVWMATDVGEGDPTKTLHEIFHSTDGGNTCGMTGVKDYGDTPDGGTFSGFGKIYFDHRRRMLVEPVLFSNSSGEVTSIGVGTATPNADDTYAFTQHKAAATPNGIVAHFPGVALDAAGTLYLTWDTDDRAKGTAGGCSQAETPVANSVMMASSKDFGQTWSAPVVVAHTEGRRVLWPWITAGTAGRVGIAYYQESNLADIDCQTADISVETTSITGADTPSPQITTTDPVGRPVAKDTTICQGGTTCVATGQDRRLGDYMTLALDPVGCEMIATGDVTQPDPATGNPRQTSLPLFVRQTSGPSLTGGDCGAPAGSPAGGSFATGPGGVTASCKDHRAPLSRFAPGRQVYRKRLRLHGTASDSGCRNAQAGVHVPGRVRAVRVAVARTVGRGCAFLRRTHRFTKPRACRKPVYLRARGTRRWSLRLSRELPDGRYRVWTSAVDAHGNAEKSHRRSNVRRFQIG